MKTNRNKPKLYLFVVLAAFILVVTGCQTTGPVTAEFEMSAPNIDMTWLVVRDQEVACGAPEVAGGEITGDADFGELGRLDIAMSAAWNVGAANLDPSAATYEPESPHAAGPFAPVLDQDDYPHQFAFNPFTQECDPTVSATGELTLTAPDGDRIDALVAGGETHRLDVAQNQEGDGIETFVEIEFDGGTGRFAGASGSAVLHLITHFDFQAGEFVIDQADVLEGATIRY